MARTDSRISVVMITHNRRDETLGTVSRLTQLPEQSRIVLVDNGSTDGTVDAVRARFPNVDVVEAGANIGAAGRNLGVERVDTPYVALCDDDTWPDPGCLRHAADLLDANPRLAILSGLVLVGPEDIEDPICAEMERSPVPGEPEMPGPALLGFLAGASVVRRAAFLSAGGFERRFEVGGEEELLALDLVSGGWWICYDRDYVVHHHPSSRRSQPSRRTALVRNALWTVWLRRSPAGAARQTARLACGWVWDADTVRGIRAALSGLPWVLRHRRAVPRWVERAKESLEAGLLAVPGVRPIRAGVS